MSAPQPKDSKNNTSSTEINPEQALGLVSLGLMQKLSDKGINNLNWLKEDEKCDTFELRQRLELTSLAIETGAPLSTTEVSKLLRKWLRSVLSDPLDSREARTLHPDEGELL